MTAYLNTTFGGSIWVALTSSGNTESGLKGACFNEVNKQRNKI